MLSYDDREHYQQILRDIVNDRMAMSSSGGASATSSKKDRSSTAMAEGDFDNDDLAQMLESKKEAKRLKKMEYDRRASKGRKVRYVPIEKLCNSMAPAPPAGVTAALRDHDDYCQWEAERVDQLMQSVFKY